MRRVVAPALVLRGLVDGVIRAGVGSNAIGKHQVKLCTLSGCGVSVGVRLAGLLLRLGAGDVLGLRQRQQIAELRRVEHVRRRRS